MGGDAQGACAHEQLTAWSVKGLLRHKGLPNLWFRIRRQSSRLSVLFVDAYGGVQLFKGGCRCLQDPNPLFKLSAFSSASVFGDRSLRGLISCSTDSGMAVRVGLEYRAKSGVLPAVAASCMEPR